MIKNYKKIKNNIETVNAQIKNKYITKKAKI